MSRWLEYMTEKPAKKGLISVSGNIIGADEIERLIREAGEGKPFDNAILVRFFREAARPMVEAMKEEAPVQKNGIWHTLHFWTKITPRHGKIMRCETRVYGP